MEILYHSTAVEVLQEINGYGDVKVTYGKSKIKEEKKSEFLEEQIRTAPPVAIEEEKNNEKVQ